MRKKIVLIVLTLVLAFTACKGKLENSSKWSVDVEKYDLWKGLSEDEKLAKSNEIRQNPTFSHLEYAESDYVDILRFKGMNMYDKVVAGVKIGDMVENKKLPTLFIFTWDNCPHCIHQLEELKGTGFEKKFNLILGQSYTEDFSQFLSEEEMKDFSLDKVKGDVKLKMIEKDKENVKAKYKENNHKDFVKYSIYGTDDLMQKMDAYYYPTLIYLNEKGEIINVSSGTSYEEILTIFGK